MLRRRFLIRVGVLIVGFVLGSAGAVWALQSLLAQIDRAHDDAATLIDGVQRVGTLMSRIESARFETAPLDPTPLIDELHREVDALSRHRITAAGAHASGEFVALADAIPPFIAAWSGAAVPPSPSADALRAGLRAHQAAHDLGRAFRGFVASEQQRIGRSFRGMVVVLTLAALVMVNVSIGVLLWTAQLVLKPVAALTEGSRQLAAEHFDHRVRVREGDEFAELAHAYNSLAERLQANEERKAEAIRHLAVTLNHDLNNAMAIIELQLGLLDREAAARPALTARLREIRSNLAQMAKTVASLKSIRRVVLTDYGPGQKMVDLERSVEPAPEPRAPAPGPHP
ncbi:MAG: HAMP domain-containing protein [Phycisphaerae bacterium]|nr:HAMP domain-containing protein [Phycisphaerae bacterium]